MEHLTTVSSLGLLYAYGSSKLQSCALNTVKLGVNVISLQNQRLIFDLNYVQKNWFSYSILTNAVFLKFFTLFSSVNLLSNAFGNSGTCT